MNPISRRQAIGRMAIAGALLTGWRKSAVATPKSSASRRNMDELRNALLGVHNFVITPFHANYDLDAEGLRRNVAYHTKLAPSPVVVGAGFGELFTLDLDEHRAVAAAAVAGGQRRMPVVVGVGGGYRLALRMARAAEESGADAILLFAPPYGSESAEGAYQYFRDVARSVKIGVILYPRGKEDYWPGVIKRLSEVPNVIGFKDASGGVTVGQALGPLIRDRLLWIAEGERHAMDAVRLGARAYTSPISDLIPGTCREFWQLGTAGDVDGMKEIFASRIEPLLQIRSVKPGYGLSGIKVALEALGRAGGPVRPPGTQVLPEDRAAIGELARKYAET